MNLCITISGNLVNKNKIFNWKLKKYLNMRVRVKNALISVSNKESLVLILKTLKKFNINIISSGSTYTYIKKLGYKCTELSKYTGFNEMLDGRVKLFTPKYTQVYFMIDKTKNIKMRCLDRIFLL